MVLTPEAGDAATTSWPCWRSLSTSFVPMSPLPPMTTIFMPNLLRRTPQCWLQLLASDIGKDGGSKDHSSAQWPAVAGQEQFRHFGSWGFGSSVPVRAYAGLRERGANHAKSAG